MVNSDNLKDKIYIENKQRELKNEIHDIKGEINDLKELKENLLSTLEIINNKICLNEDKLNKKSDELDQAILCYKFIYDGLSKLGSTYEYDKKLSSEYRKFLECHGCKIICDDQEENKYKIKRIYLDGSK